MNSNNEPIEVGHIRGAFGVQGHVLVKSDTKDPFDMMRYGALIDQNGTSYTLSPVRINSQGYIITRIEGISSRTQADALKGTKFFILRTQLPDLPQDEYYFNDLVGLSVMNDAAQIIGTVQTIQDFGGGPFLDILLSGGKIATLPFHSDSVLKVDLKAGHIHINMDFLLES